MIAIDLGSNTLRVLAYDCQSKQTLYVYEKVVKTADGLADSGLISNAALLRVIDAIDEAKSQIDFSLHAIRAVTTEAVRSASNADEILRQILVMTGVSFEIISGEKEAALTLLAVENRLSLLHLPSDDFVLVDIGGGSTEVIFYKQKQRVSRSFPVGIVTIAQRYKTLETIGNALAFEMHDMALFIEEVYAIQSKPKAFVATAGTPTTVAAMKHGLNYENYDADVINGTTLEKEVLHFYLQKLLALPFKEREIAVGTGRSDLVAAGILIYKYLYTLLGFRECVVIDDGLREGVVLDFCQKRANLSDLKIKKSLF
jgi:exopolyphosphatase/guanosine-5'-triphosphate,3'-diphosphate pyrophosphatase